MARMVRGARQCSRMMGTWTLLLLSGTWTRGKCSLVVMYLFFLGHFYPALRSFPSTFENYGLTGFVNKLIPDLVFGSYLC